MLEVKPNSDYLGWLAARLMPEKPFVGYHAALALVAAARTLDVAHRDAVRAAIEQAQQNLGPALDSTDRGQALALALSELEEAHAVTTEYPLRDSRALDQ